jgi:hypothetical protein
MSDIKAVVDAAVAWHDSIGLDRIRAESLDAAVDALLAEDSDD